MASTAAEQAKTLFHPKQDVCGLLFLIDGFQADGFGLTCERAWRAMRLNKQAEDGA